MASMPLRTPPPHPRLRRVPLLQIATRTGIGACPSHWPPGPRCSGLLKGRRTVLLYCLPRGVSPPCVVAVSGSERCEKQAKELCCLLTCCPKLAVHPEVTGVPGHPQLVLPSPVSRAFVLRARPRLLQVMVIATGIFLVFPFALGVKEMLSSAEAERPIPVRKVSPGLWLPLQRMNLWRERPGR